MKKIGKKGAPVITNQIAWCLAQLGQPAKALELAQSVLAQLESMGPQFTARGYLVIGTSFLFLGKPQEAISHLERANNTTFASTKSVASFYLAECYPALGDTQKARLAYHQAHEASPNGKFGTRALEHAQRCAPPEQFPQVLASPKRTHQFKRFSSIDPNPPPIPPSVQTPLPLSSSPSSVSHS